MTREQIQAGYVFWLVENMTHMELVEFFAEQVNNDLDELDGLEAIEEIKDYMGADFQSRFGTPVLSYA